ncbi:hypothetical protein Tco_1047130 [Tanacetum coccineum]
MVQREDVACSGFGSRIVLDEEQMAFLGDNRDTVAIGQDSQELITTAIFQTDDLDAFDFDCDEAPSANAMIMFVIKEMSNQVSKCNEVNKVNKTVSESLTAELERYKEQIKIFEEQQNFDLTDREKYIDGQIRGVIIDRNAKFDIYQKEIQTLKLQLSANIKSHKVLHNQMDVLKREFSKKQDKYIEEIVDLEKKKKALENKMYKTGQTVQTMHMLTKLQVF